MSFSFRPLLAVAAIALATPAFAETPATTVAPKAAVAPSTTPAPMAQSGAAADVKTPVAGSAIKTDSKAPAATTSGISSKDKVATNEKTVPKHQHKAAKSVIPAKSDASVKSDSALSH